MIKTGLKGTTYNISIPDQLKAREAEIFEELWRIIHWEEDRKGFYVVKTKQRSGFHMEWTTIHTIYKYKFGLKWKYAIVRISHANEWKSTIDISILYYQGETFRFTEGRY